MAGRPTFDELAGLLAELRAEPRENITPDTRLREDLGIDGDDWDEVLIAIRDRSPMDWKGEPSWRSLMFAVRDLLAGRRLKSLTVGHLSLVLQHGKWVEPPGQAA